MFVADAHDAFTCGVLSLRQYGTRSSLNPRAPQGALGEPQRFRSRGAPAAGEARAARRPVVRARHREARCAAPEGRQAVWYWSGGLRRREVSRLYISRVVAGEGVGRVPIQESLGPRREPRLHARAALARKALILDPYTILAHEELRVRHFYRMP